MNAGETLLALLALVVAHEFAQRALVNDPESCKRLAPLSEAVTAILGRASELAEVLENKPGLESDSNGTT